MSAHWDAGLKQLGPTRVRSFVGGYFKRLALGGPKTINLKNRVGASARMRKKAPITLAKVVLPE